MRRNFVDSIREHWVESLLLAGLLAIAGWMLSELYGINRSVGALEAKLETRLNESSGRIDRIAAVLPDVRIRIAQDELDKSVRVAVVVRKPREKSPGEWVTAVQLYESGTHANRTYLVPAEGPEDKKIEWLVSGAAMEADKDAVSFSSLSRLAWESNRTLTSPTDVQTKASFVLRNPSPDFEKVLSTYLVDGGAKVYSLQLKTRDFEKYEGIVKELNKTPLDYSQLTSIKQPSAK